MNLATVNVIDIKNAADSAIQSMESFPDNTEGCKAAQTLFAEWVRQAKGDEEVSEADMETYIEQGMCEIGEGAILLVHSNGGQVPGASMPEDELFDHDELVEMLAQEVIDGTENQDDLSNYLQVYQESLGSEVDAKVKEMAETAFCETCGASLRPVTGDTDGTNMAEWTECSNPECPSHP